MSHAHVHAHAHAHAHANAHANAHAHAHAHTHVHVVNYLIRTYTSLYWSQWRAGLRVLVLPSTRQLGVGRDHKGVDTLPHLLRGGK